MAEAIAADALEDAAAPVTAVETVETVTVTQPGDQADAQATTSVVEAVTVQDEAGNTATVMVLTGCELRLLSKTRAAGKLSWKCACLPA